METSPPLEIFATDISETAIEKARAGVYASAAVAHVSPQRLARFFIRSERGYQIAKIVREVCVFARHNVGQDPPFSKLDLISCCNVLIYLEPHCQRKVLSILRYALEADRLPGARSVGKRRPALRVVPSGGPDSPDLLHAAGRECASAAPDRRPPRRGARGSPAENYRGRAGTEVLREADRLVLAGHSPPGAVVDNEMNIVQVRGRTAHTWNFRRASRLRIFSEWPAKA